MEDIKKIVFCFCVVIVTVEAGQYCGRNGNQEFYCDKGHCCGDFKCCSYYRYYEMWWFWLIWCIIIMLGCSCAYYRKNRLGTYSYLTNYFYPMVPPTPTSATTDSPTPDNPNTEPSYKLPSYEEAIGMPQLGPPNDNDGAPPPYVSFAENPLNNETQLNSIHMQHSVELNTSITETSQPEQQPCS